VAKHSIAEVASRVPVMADYIHIDQQGAEELNKVRKDVDASRKIIVRYAVEDWIQGILEAYDPVISALTDEILARNPPKEEEQLQIKRFIRDEARAGRKVKAIEARQKPLREPKKKVSVKAYGNTRAYTKSKPKHYENKVKTRLFIKSRSGLSNKDLTKEYNAYAVEHSMKIRSVSGITTLKCRINKGRW
jgi:hypothetical protein